MKSVSTFEVIVARLKEAAGITSDAGLADAMGIKRNAFYNRRSAQSLPYEEVIHFSVAQKLCLDWVFTGSGEPRPGQTVERVKEVDSDLLSAVLVALRSALWKGPTAMPYALKEEAAVIGGLAGLIYNSAANVADPLRQRDVLVREAAYTSSVMRIAEGARAGPFSTEWMTTAKTKAENDPEKGA